MNDEGKRGGPRMRWLTDRHGKALYDRAVAVLGALRSMGAVADAPDISLFYIFIGAVGLIFSQAPECKRLAGIDPTASRAVVDAHADAVVRVLLR
jgi:hypothetical protein